MSDYVFINRGNLAGVFYNWPFSGFGGIADYTKPGFESVANLGGKMVAPPVEALEFLQAREYTFSISHLTYPESYGQTIKSGQAYIDGATVGDPWEWGLDYRWSLPLLATSSSAIAYFEGDFIFNASGAAQDYASVGLGVCPPVMRIEQNEDDEPVEIWRPSFALSFLVERRETIGSLPPASFSVGVLTYDGEVYNLSGSAADYLIEITPS